MRLALAVGTGGDVLAESLDDEPDRQNDLLHGEESHERAPSGAEGGGGGSLREVQRPAARPQIASHPGTRRARSTSQDSISAQRPKMMSRYGVIAASGTLARALMTPEAPGPAGTEAMASHTKAVAAYPIISRAPRNTR